MNIIDLNKKYVFRSLLFLIVFVLTYINNYGFYKYVEIRDYQEIRTLAKTIHYQFNSSENIESSLQKTKKLLKSLGLFISVKILDQNHQLILDYSNIKERHLNRKLVHIPKYLNNLHNMYTLDITKHSFPNIFNTTMKSITLSVSDVYHRINHTNIQTAINWYIDQKIYLRSQAFALYLLFAYLLLHLIRWKQLQLSRELVRQNTTIVNLSKNIESAKENEIELYDMLNQLKSTQINLKEKLKQYESIINPPIDLLNFEDIISLDPESIIFKCRKVTEKLITLLYNKNIGGKGYKTLDDMIKELRNKKILNKKVLSYANTIKAFGNISAHPDFENPFEFTQEDAKIISNALILLIEELNEK